MYFVLGIVYPPRDFAYNFIGFVLMSGVCLRWVLFFNDVFVVVAARRWPSGDTIVSPLGWRRPSIIEMSSFSVIRVLCPRNGLSPTGVCLLWI